MTLQVDKNISCWNRFIPTRMEFLSDLLVGPVLVQPPVLVPTWCRLEKRRLGTGSEDAGHTRHTT